MDTQEFTEHMEEKTSEKHSSSASNRQAMVISVVILTLALVLAVSMVINILFLGSLMLVRTSPSTFNNIFHDMCIFGCFRAAVLEVPVADLGGGAAIISCIKSGLPTVQTEQVKMTVTSVEIRKNNVDSSRLFINLAVQNLTNSRLRFQLIGNLRVLESGKEHVLSAPDSEYSSWFQELTQPEAVDKQIVVNGIPDTIPAIDLEFFNSLVNDAVEPGIRINGIPSVC